MLKKSILFGCLLASTTFSIIGCSTHLPVVSNNILSPDEQKESQSISTPLGFYQMGSMYDYGGIRPLNLDKAVYYYTKASDLGSVDALNALGVIKINLHEYEQAKSYFDKAAQKGDEIAYFNLGNLALIDHQLSDRSAVAIDMYLNSSKKNYAPAYTALGDIYSEGKGISPDYKKAEQYYQKGAELGDDNAVNRLALLYILQDGDDATDDTENAKKTFDLIKLTADKGNAQSLYIMSLAYQNGFIVPQDQKMALDYLQKSADKNWTEALYSLGFLYLAGFGVDVDVDKGVALLTKAAQQGSAEAQNNLGMLYLKGEVIPRNTELAEKYLKMGIDNGYAMSAYNLSLAYTMGLITIPNDQEVKSLLLFSADHGYTPAMNRIAELYSKGQFGFIKNEEESRKWINLSIEAGDSDAKVMLANAYFFGSYGYAKDHTKANEWLKKAKDDGNSSVGRVESLWKSIDRAATTKELKEKHERKKQG